MKNGTDNRINDIDCEILAALTAAIASADSKTGCRLVVKSFRRIGQSSPVWNTTGRVERLRRYLNS